MGNIMAQMPQSEFANVCQVIYQQLRETIGDKDVKWPDLSIWNVEDRGGVYLSGSNDIYLDHKLVEACTKFGALRDDAIAFIIAHEMTHFYQAHQWGEAGLLGRFMLSDKTFQSHRNLEAEADLFGAFLSYQAGYNTVDLIPRLLDSIYLLYNLDTVASRQYPSLEDRKLVANESCDLAKVLIEMYQMANYQMVLGNSDAARDLYNHVGKSLQFKELHYNIGLSCFMAFLQLEGISLRYPMAIAPEIPIRRDLLRKSPDTLLKEAMDAFELVLTLYDPGYVNAVIQLISVYDWTGNREKAAELIAQSEKNPQIADNHHFILSKANFFARNGEQSGAIHWYNVLISRIDDSEGSRYLAKTNRDYLLGKKPGESRGTPVIHNQTELDGVHSLVFYKSYQHSTDILPDWQFSFATEYNSTVSRLARSRSIFSMQRFQTPVIQTRQKLGVGSTVQQLYRHFTPDEIAYSQHSHGQYLVIYEEGLIFKLNTDSVVEEWISFSF